MKLKTKKVVLFGTCTLCFHNRQPSVSVECRSVWTSVAVGSPWLSNYGVQTFFSVSLEKLCLRSIFGKDGKLSLFQKGGWVSLVMDNKNEF